MGNKLVGILLWIGGIAAAVFFLYSGSVAAMTAYERASIIAATYAFAFLFLGGSATAFVVWVVVDYVRTELL